jgi:hypothetical protein
MAKYKVVFEFSDTLEFEVEADDKKAAKESVLEQIDCCRDAGGHPRNPSEFGFVVSVTKSRAKKSR